MSVGVLAALGVYVGIPAFFAFIYLVVIPRMVDRWWERRASSSRRAFYAARDARDGVA
jgi:hypothetical protein